MLILSVALLVAAPEASAFPEQVPGLIEACLTAAVASGQVSDTDDSHKYICAGETADRLWTFLERAKIHSYEQETPNEGRWLSRDFPLGGCFRRVRMSDGGRPDGALSCTIWVPRLVTGAPAGKP